MNSYEEIQNYIDNIDCGKAVYDINESYGNLRLTLPDWQAEKEAANSRDWLVRCTAYDMRRRFCNLEKKLILADKDDLQRDFCRQIFMAVRDTAKDVSPAKMPKRTNAYKDFVEVARRKMEDKDFINDVLPVLNYWLDNKTDSKVKQNVYGLFEILRKKHDTSNRSTS